MIRILGRRWPLAKVTLYPAQVQGQGAAESIARALGLANAVARQMLFCAAVAAARWRICGRLMKRPSRGRFFPRKYGDFRGRPRAGFHDCGLRGRPARRRRRARPSLRSPTGQTRWSGARWIRGYIRRRIEQSRQSCWAAAGAACQTAPLRTISRKSACLLDQMADRLLSAVPARLGRESQPTGAWRQRLATAGQGGLHRRCLRFAQTVATVDAMSPLRVLARGHAVATKGAAHGRNRRSARSKQAIPCVSGLQKVRRTAA